MARLQEVVRSGIVRFAPLRFVARGPVVQRALLAYRGARVVKERMRFLVRELAGLRGPASYRLAETDATFLVRHNVERLTEPIGPGTGDPYVLVELFHRRHYEPPPGVARRIDGRRPLRVLDLGANIGLFGLFVLARYPDAEVTALEPDPGSAAMLRRCIDLNGLGSRWRLVEACAGTEERQVSFMADEFANSHIVARDAPGAIEVGMVDFYELARGFDFIKMDIQGGEWDLLRDPRLSSVDAPALVLEWHAASSQEDDPLEAVTVRLSEAGYHIVRVDPAPTSQTGVVWAGRRV